VGGLFRGDLGKRAVWWWPWAGRVLGLRGTVVIGRHRD
jgi:hypothetical protein